MQSVQPILQELINNGLVTEEQAIRANAESTMAPAEPNGHRKDAAEFLVNQGTITEENMIDAIAKINRVPAVHDPLRISPDMVALEKITEEQAHSLDAVPLNYNQKSGLLEIAITPNRVGNLNYKDDMIRITGARNVKFSVISPNNLAIAWKRVYRAEANIGRLTRNLQEESDKKLLTDSAKSGDTTEVDELSETQQIVLEIIRQAISDGASDIHMEPTGHSLVMRQRVDGVLRELEMNFKSFLVNRISSVVKIMAHIDLSRKQETHDGRLSLTDNNGREVDLRVSVIPSIHGESIVMRIADNTLAAVDLDELGFSPHNYERFMKVMNKPYGMMLVTGPTGSGKSTTLYAALNQITTPEKKIITVEDPVEYRIGGITQIEVQPPRAGQTSKLDFPNVLRAILRHDPDVILVGEVRDFETAQISMDAAMTGHLVLTTLHTNSAAAAVTRLKEMGVEPYLVGGVAEGVLAQRLIRRLCVKCKQSYTPTSRELVASGYWQEDKGVSIELFRPNPEGCLVCGGSGYKGRVAVHEVMIIDDMIEDMIVSGATTAELERAAQAEGMHTLRDDGWEKVSAGVTSIDEILRVIA